MGAAIPMVDNKGGVQVFLADGPVAATAVPPAVSTPVVTTVPCSSTVTYVLNAWTGLAPVVVNEPRPVTGFTFPPVKGD